jgi:branched-subunit amino acid ABC-type transport system permease component
VDELTRLAIDGQRFDLIIAITGAGLSLIFSTTGLTNFVDPPAHSFGGRDSLRPRFFSSRAR